VVSLIYYQQVEKSKVASRGVQHLVEQTLDSRRPQPGKTNDHPRIHGERVGLQPVAAPQLLQGISIEHGEREPKLVAHLVTPLQDQRRRTHHQDPSGPMAKQHLLDH
jgi:hypothetical protein